jgi:hypothetical protein
MSTQMETIQLVLFRECLRKQIEEFELLKSIYSMPGEFKSDNPLLVSDIEDFLSGLRTSVHEKLDFRLKIQLTEKVKMELSVVLGQLYPSHELPMFTVRTDSLTKAQEKLVKRAIENFIETEVDKSEPYIYQVVVWLQDHIDEIVARKEEVEAKDEEKTAEMERTWLWSHHIYSKIKRHDILKLAKNHRLAGFMWPGKPGVICFEGAEESVQEVVKIVKGWQWQKLKIVRTESFTGDPKFSSFEEILTGDSGDGEDVKMDTSQFFKYLDSHNSSHMRKELFGFD